MIPSLWARDFESCDSGFPDNYFVVSACILVCKQLKLVEAKWRTSCKDTEMAHGTQGLNAIWVGSSENTQLNSPITTRKTFYFLGPKTKNPRGRDTGDQFGSVALTSTNPLCLEVAILCNRKY